MSYGPNEMEHRWEARVQVNIPVCVEAATLPIGNGWMKDLSLSGAFIKSDRDLRLHTLIEVSIALPPPSWRTVVIEAHVRESSMRVSVSNGASLRRVSSKTWCDLHRDPLLD